MALKHGRIRVQPLPDEKPTDPLTVFHFLCTRLVTTSCPEWRYKLGPQQVGSSENWGSDRVSTAKGPRTKRIVLVGVRSSTEERRRPMCTLCVCGGGRIRQRWTRTVSNAGRNGIGCSKHTRTQVVVHSQRMSTVPVSSSLSCWWACENRKYGWMRACNSCGASPHPGTTRPSPRTRCHTCRWRCKTRIPEE